MLIGVPYCEKNIKMNGKKHLLFGRKNYSLILIAVLLVFSGYLLMTGSPNQRGESFNYEIYNFRRITVAPIVLLAGYVLMIICIMMNPGGKK